MELFRAAFPDQIRQIDNLLADGDKVITRRIMTVTHTGEFFGRPPTNMRVDVTGIHILRIEDGRIVENWGNNDDLGMMRQLDAIPD